MISINSKLRVLLFRGANGRAPFEQWLSRLDKRTQARLSARIVRFEDGHFGDHKLLSGGIYEARFFMGPGYRVYFAIHRREVILLLIGGTKSSQVRDIAKARLFYKLYLKGLIDADEK